MRFFLLVLLFILAASVLADGIGTIGKVTQQTVLGKLESGSQFVQLDTEPAYADPVYILNLRGEPYNQGYDAGVLVGEQWDENYQSLFTSFFKDFEDIEPLLQKVTEAFLDWQWADYLSQQVPQEYLDELRGLKEGGESIGVPDLDLKSSRGIVLANFPGSADDFVYILIDEFKSTHGAFSEEEERAVDHLAKTLVSFGHQCSMFGVFGSRTQEGRLLSGRNLDWEKDLGINKYKMIIVNHPPSGNAHASVGFAGIWGTLTGMSAKGLTVHEANLESSSDSFLGFPWVLRLRHVMAYASNLEEGLNLMLSTNNTVGFNHAIGSAPDNSALVFETMAGYTAYFADYDDREVGAIDPQTGEVYGFPLKDAVYRTNHGYDPVTQELYQWYGTHAYSNSKARYNYFYDYFSQKEQAGSLLGAPEAVEIVSIVGQKGDGSNEYECDPDLYYKGSNVLSVAFDPSKNTLYAAWEDKSGDDWTPAACSPYIEIDMSQWW
jgi:hypothetical protein